MFNSHLFDFTEGWFYVFGVGAIGGGSPGASSRPRRCPNRRPGPPAQARMCPASSRAMLFDAICGTDEVRGWVAMAARSHRRFKNYIGG